ncbi:ABC transporter permease subunit [Allomesorhizobium camelthorni]|uniref:ABC transporter permease subunit n=1 Tax=Allomesorhizobium camelthorni TaxID=475069 RepID=A0A6G4WME5_9HYPH|nr:ABC transporter permease subunit [Mesorhizobium camelthorni]NGO55804.1 ABC transporter permease subunit [Mesorhizobium camelthorni]
MTRFLMVGRRERAVVLLLAGPLLFLLCFFYIPLAQTLWMSFWERGVFTLDNYQQALSSALYLNAFAWTFELAFFTAFLTLIVGYPVAYAMSTSGPRLRLFILICIIIPFWTSALVRAFAWVGILGREGIVNSSLMYLSIISSPMQLVFNPTGVFIGTVHVMLPYMVLCLYSSMHSIDRSLIRAAETLGAGRIRSFLLVYVPQTAPGIISGLLLVFIVSLGFFITPAVLGSNQRPTVVVLVERHMGVLLDWSMAAALSSLLLATTLVLFAVFNRYVRAGHSAPELQGAEAISLYRMVAKIDRGLGAIRAPLRRWRSDRPGRRWRFRGPAPSFLTLIAILISAIVAFPILLIVLVAFFPSTSNTIDFSNFSLEWFELYFTRAEWVDATLNSFRIALLTAVLASVISLVTALGLRRLSPGIRTALMSINLAPMIVPAVAYGVSAYFLFAQLGLIGTTLSLIIGHTILAIPPTMLVMVAAVQSLDERLEDAAASLGASPWRRLRYVTLPLLAPMAVVSALIGFLTSFDDLAVALFLASSRAKTLPKQMYDSMLHDSDPRVAAASAVLVGFTIVALLAMHLLRSRSRTKIS